MHAQMRVLTVFVSQNEIKVAFNGFWGLVRPTEIMPKIIKCKQKQFLESKHYWVKAMMAWKYGNDKIKLAR